jgi:hypothetical protein
MQQCNCCTAAKPSSVICQGEIDLDHITGRNVARSPRRYMTTPSPLPGPVPSGAAIPRPSGCPRMSPSGRASNSSSFGRCGGPLPCRNLHPRDDCAFGGVAASDVHRRPSFPNAQACDGGVPTRHQCRDVGIEPHHFGLIGPARSSCGTGANCPRWPVHPLTSASWPWLLSYSSSSLFFCSPRSVAQEAFLDAGGRNGDHDL